MNTKIVCQKLSVTPKALRIYEEYKIVVPKRDENNYRNYNEEDLLRLRQVMLLKEMGISLSEIKILLDKELEDSYKLLRGMNLQLKAVENKIHELENIKATLQQSINDALDNSTGKDYNQYLDKIGDCLMENRQNRSRWIDKWSFDTWARSYDTAIKDMEDDELKLFEKYDYVIDMVIASIAPNNSTKIIDLGCGTGNLFGILKGCCEFVGIDQSVEMLIQAKAKYPEMNLRLGNFLDKPYVENDFDIVVSTYAFHHLTQLEKEKAVNLMLQYLKPKGKIIIADLMFLNENDRVKQKEYFYNQNRQDLWDIIEDEYYTDIEKIINYAELLGCSTTYKHLSNFTWLLEIEKH